MCGLSGGVDSTVAASLIHHAIGDRLQCIFVDNGLLRLNESKQVVERYKKLALPVHPVDATDIFLSRLAGVVDPEQKRKIIGGDLHRHLRRQGRRARRLRLPGAGHALSRRDRVGVGARAVGDDQEPPQRRRPARAHEVQAGRAAPRALQGRSARASGRDLGIDKEFLVRQPFPGPGLAVRILGDITRDRIALLQKADAIVADEVRKAGWYERLWQSFAVLLPIQSVGVMGDARTYESTIAVRAVESLDGMTADWARLPHELLASISSRIVNEVKGINRVVYDISSKPPSTIEWE